jgi:hypothetical protein
MLLSQLFYKKLQIIDKYLNYLYNKLMYVITKYNGEMKWGEEEEE